MLMVLSLRLWHIPVSMLTSQKDILPQGTLNVTGILTRYNNAWQLIIRTGSDVKRNK